MSKTRSLRKKYFLISLATVCLFIILFISFLVYYEYQKFIWKSAEVSSIPLDNELKELNATTLKIATFIRNEKNLAKEKLESQVENRLNYGFGFVENIYKKYGKKESKDVVIKRITDTFLDFRLGEDSYFFIFDKNFNQIIGNYRIPSNIRLDELPDIEFLEAIRRIKNAAMHGGGFVDYKWTKEKGSDELIEKVSYVRYFEPYELIIGTGDYIEDVSKAAKSEALRVIEHLLDKEDVFYYVLDLKNERIISHSENKLSKAYIKDLDTNGKKSALNDIINFSKLNSEGALKFNWSEDDSLVPMLSYNIAYTDWDWVIGSAVYIGDLQNIINEERSLLLVNLFKSSAFIVLAFGIVSTVAFFSARRFSEDLEEEFAQFLNFFETATQEGAHIDPDKTRYEEFRRLAVHANKMSAEIKNKTVALEEAMDAQSRANFAKTEIISYVSHELRTPLAGVLGFIELLDGTELDKIQKHFLRNIKHSSKNLIGVVNDIMDFSKLETGSLELINEKFHSLSSFETASELFGFIASERGLDFAFYIDHTIPSELFGDVARINQILSNLVENAAKFNHPGGYIKLEIVCKEKNSETVKLRFSIEDSGEGVPIEKRHIIQNLFTLEDLGIRQNFEKLRGLGLSVSTNLVKLMDGVIGYYPAVESLGSVFFFELDFKISNEKPAVNVERISDCYSAVFVSDRHEGAGTLEELLMRYMLSFGNEASYFSSLSDIEKLPFLDVIFYVYSETTKEMFLESIRNYEGIPIVVISDLHRRFDEDVLIKLASSVLYKPAGLSSIYESIYIATSYMYDEVEKEETSKQAAASFNGTALVAEDNPVNQKMVKLMLKELGVDSVCVSNGREALEAFKENKFDIVIMDINMPELGGIEAAKLINEYEKEKFLSHVPIIALTAYAIKGDSERFMEAGMDDYLAKPVSIDIMREALQKHL